MKVFLLAYTDKELNVSVCNIEFCQEYAPGLSYSSYRPSWRVGAMGTMYKRVRENVKNDNFHGYYATHKEDCVAGIHQIQLGNTFLCSLPRCIVFPSGDSVCYLPYFHLGIFLDICNTKKA